VRVVDDLAISVYLSEEAVLAEQAAVEPERTPVTTLLDQLLLPRLAEELRSARDAASGGGPGRVRRHPAGDRERGRGARTVRRHLRRSLPGSDVLVLKRNNSENRLEAATALQPGSALAARLQGAEPRTCLALRFGRTHREDPGRTALLSCLLCARRASRCWWRAR